MKIFILFLIGFSEAYAQKYVLLKSYDIQDSIVQSLDEPLRALAAWYSAAGGTGCGDKYIEDTTNPGKKHHHTYRKVDRSDDSERCELTTALGLGAQGSDVHKALLKKYFYDDRAAEQFIKQNCHIRNDDGGGNPPFTRFEDLSFTRKKNIITVNYTYHYFAQYIDEDEVTKGPDLWKIDGDHLIAIKRNIWKSYLKKKKKRRI